MNKDYIFEYSSNLDHYTADAFVVRCFDDRFREIFEAFIKHLGTRRHFDFESVAGGAKIFSSPEQESDRGFILRELEKSIRLHHAKKVLLFTHHDCGAYGGLAKFEGDVEKEFSFHTTEHKKALAVIRERFPELSVEIYFLDAMGVVKTSSF